MSTGRNPEAGNLNPIPQDDRTVTLAPPLCKKSSKINWQNSAFSISCQIRGLDPWPMAHTFLDNKKLRLFDPQVSKESCSSPPGTILRVMKDTLLIACREGALLIKEIQQEGGRRMPVDAFIRGHNLTEGTLLV